VLFLFDLVSCAMLAMIRQEKTATTAEIDFCGIFCGICG
jgi:hypothetical protein